MNHEEIVRIAMLENGAQDGHPFYGNQYSDSAADADIRSDPSYRSSKEIAKGVVHHDMHTNATSPRSHAEGLVAKARAGGDTRARVVKSTGDRAEAVIHSKGKTHWVNYVKGYDSGKR